VSRFKYYRSLQKLVEPYYVEMGLDNLNSKELEFESEIDNKKVTEEDTNINNNCQQHI
jgi:hypothetical protein